MKLYSFLKRYKVTHDAGNIPAPSWITNRVDDEFLFCMEQLGGKTFNHGLYRVYRWDQIGPLTDVTSRLFSPTSGKIIVFAADWSGRQFAIDFTEQSDGKPTVGCFDLGAPDSFSTDQPILTFHNEALVQSPDAALAKAFYKRWRRIHKEDISPDLCVAYKVPLFLGGNDDLSNLEIMEMTVYLDLCAQLWGKIKDLPEGTSIGDIGIDAPHDE